MAESAAWDDIGLGAITDFVQQAFGPAELDGSLVELTVTAAPGPGCPACAGRRFKFPADLADGRDRMCPAHRQEADAVIGRRMARAEASNPAGWRMLADASARLSLPHLPGGLATRLAGAGKDLVRRARLLAEAAAGFAGRPEASGSALAENHDQAGRFPGWPVTLIGDLGRAGQGTEAVMLSEALAVVDPASTVCSPVRRQSRWPKPGSLTTRGRRSPRTSNAGPMTSGPGYSPVTRWPSSAMPRRRSPISRGPCRGPSRPRTSRRSVTCPREYSGSPVPPPVRRCIAASPGPGRPDPSARADGNRSPGWQCENLIRCGPRGCPPQSSVPVSGAVRRSCHHKRYYPFSPACGTPRPVHCPADGVEYQAVGQVTSSQVGADDIDGCLSVGQSLPFPVGHSATRSCSARARTAGFRSLAGARSILVPRMASSSAWTRPSPSRPMSGGKSTSRSTSLSGRSSPRATLPKTRRLVTSWAAAAATRSRRFRLTCRPAGPDSLLNCGS